MVKKSDIAWSVVGVGAVVFSCVLLYRQVRGISLDDLGQSLAAIGHMDWLLALAATLGAYTALAWYDRIALNYLGRRISWWFISLCSFTTYALAHNIGATLFSGALIRYRAYRTKGLTPHEIGIVIVFCAFTFTLGSLLCGGVVLIIQPDLIGRLLPLPPWLSITTGIALLALIAMYVRGSWRQYAPLDWGRLHVEYPRLGIVARQLIAGPVELLCAAAIIHFALPEASHPGYVTVLGVFLLSFSLALISHAPGGLGVLEVTFIAALPEIPTADLLAALIVFRCFYLLAPFALSLFVVLGFEMAQWRARAETPP